MKVIFGSGIIGALAKAILPSWKLVPFKRSRFFSFNPPLDDNFIIRDGRLEYALRDLFGQQPTYPYRVGFSTSGALLGGHQQQLVTDWAFKVFGDQPPKHLDIYLANHFEFQVYGLKVNELYTRLINQFAPEIKAEAACGEVTEIGDHYYVQGGQRFEFERAIATIPLPAMGALMGTQLALPAKDLHYFHLQSKAIDLEGFNQVLVTDRVLDFFKVTRLAPDRYLFYCLNDLPQPGAYFMAVLGLDFELLDGTMVREALPLGYVPQLPLLTQAGIDCVGSYAQWDWCMDVGSCLIRILNLTT